MVRPLRWPISLYSCSQHGFEFFCILIHMKKLPADFEYLPDMYQDGYFPNFLVDKIKAEIVNVVAFIEEGGHSIELIQESLDQMTIAINGFQDEFMEHGSEIETGAREAIGDTIEKILNFFELDIDVEEAIRERDW
jgi:Family of unknown function (DUF5713)